MPNTYFQFKHFRIEQGSCAMKVTTDACAFGAWVASEYPLAKSVLDVGAGTGLLSLMLAQAGAEAVDAIEIETNCFHQLKENSMQSVFNDHITAIHADFLKFETEKRYDLIVSNPPFHENQLKSDSTSINLARHSDSMPLLAFFQKSKSLMHEESELFVLIPVYRKNETLELAQQIGLHAIQMVDLHHDATHAPFRSLLRFSQKGKSCSEETLCIYERENQYSQRFKSLIEPYYLHA